jgi:ribosomal protein L11 methyltransferase
MYLWRKTAGSQWVKAHENLLQVHARGALVIVRRPVCKRLQVEIFCSRRGTSEALVAEFGGRIEKLPRNWLERFALDNSKPIRIGKRLVIVRSINQVQGRSVRCPQWNSRRGVKPDALKTAHSTAQTTKPQPFMIPASIAFGTGEHTTTAMSLRLLEQLTRGWQRGWSVLDLGTGSGILALAAKRFGAGHVVGIDRDPTAILTAKSNARLNRIRGVKFQLADVREWKLPPKTQLIIGNLYSGLLIEMLPRLKGRGWLIVSGILRSQRNEFLRALQRHDLEIVSLKCRGKWIALLARKRSL